MYVCVYIEPSSMIGTRYGVYYTGCLDDYRGGCLDDGLVEDSGLSLHGMVVPVEG